MFCAYGIEFIESSDCFVKIVFYLMMHICILLRCINKLYIGQFDSKQTFYSTALDSDATSES